ncbi:MAG: DUF494 domain-containing protein [Gammaproteobacteria bacterium]|nr:DUF494 domain-containing protein [Gammaproteobacteria bacterium]MDH5694077.1 DUF494 domain-containing protein [Gammaproteobacteria bacterium]
MKENVFDVLLYVFENYMDTDQPIYPDRDELELELQEAGFTRNEVEKALKWLDGLDEVRNQPLDQWHPQSSIRIYTPAESKKINTECRGFLHFLESIGVVDQTVREWVIDRAMALDTQDFDLEQMKWIVLMVLFSQPGQEAALAWMEDLIYEEQQGTLH